MKLGIVGLPNVGKSTMFNSITKAGAECANYPFCTIEPNVGVVPVPDERLDALTKMYNPQKTTHAVVEFVDIAGLVKGASKGEGLGNKFLSHIRETDAIVEVVRCFEDSNVVHVDGSVDPVRDIETINLELIFADIETVNKRLDKARKNLKADKKYQEEIDLLEKIKTSLENGISARAIDYTKEEQELVKDMFLLTTKPILYIANVSEEQIEDPENDENVKKVKEYALKETVFSHVYRKGLTFDRTFRMSEVLYFRLSNKNIRSLLSNLCAGYDELLNEAVDKYEKAGGEKGTLKIDAIASGKKYGERSFEEVFEDLMNNRFKTFFNSRSAVLPLFDGFNYTKQAAEQSKKSTSEVKDITDILDEIVETVARAFSIPVSLLKGDVSDVEKITRNFLTFCIDPLCEMIQKEINRKRYGRKEIQKGNYLKIDTTAVMHIDVFDIAEKIDKLIASGMYCVDELRQKLGDAELGTEESQMHFITKNYTELSGISDVKGGDTG